MKNLITIIILLLASGVYANNFYLDATNGLDLNDGLSPSTAWQTIDKVNNFQFSPGDSILFKRGETFRGNINSTSGSESSDIVYGAYGAGVRPKILGSIQKKSPMDWANEGGNIWSTTELFDLTGPELLPNPDFDENSNGWYSWASGANGASVTLSRTVADGTYTTAPGGGQLSCAGNGTGFSDVQLYTANCSIESSKWYRFVFKAKTSAAFTIPSGRILLLHNGTPFTNFAVSSKALNITTSWETYEIFFKSNATSDKVRLQFYLGNIIPDSGIFYFDSLSLKETTVDPGLIQTDIGNIIFNDEAYCGVKVINAEQMDGQGKFWFDSENKKLKIYSVGNPGNFYTNIELALTNHLIYEGNKSYIVYEDLDLRYAGAHGIAGGNTHHIHVKDMNFSYIGGGYLKGYSNGTTRYGNGVEFYGNANNNIVERCTFSQIYDVAVTLQGDSPEYQVFDVYFMNNIIDKCEQSFELWLRGSGTAMYDVYFEHNTCLNAGMGWAHAQRPFPNGCHLLFWGDAGKPGDMHDIFIRNNIFSVAANYGIFATNWSDISIAKMTIDYNDWYVDNQHGDWGTSSSDITVFNWNAYRTATGQDANSLTVSPLLDAANSLTSNSPCINAGTSLTKVTGDFNKISRPQGGKYDIGAYELIPTVTGHKVELNRFNIFPNPVSSRLSVTTPYSDGKSTLSIYNIYGQELIGRKLNENNVTVELGNLKKGSYFISLTNSDFIEVQKIIKK